MLFYLDELRLWINSEHLVTICMADEKYVKRFRDTDIKQRWQQNVSMDTIIYDEIKWKL